MNILKNENDTLRQENNFINKFLEKLTQNADDKDQRIEALLRAAEDSKKEFRTKMKTLQFKLNFARNQIKIYEDFKFPHTLRERDLKIDACHNFTDEM